jgi:PhnB protein
MAMPHDARHEPGPRPHLMPMLCYADAPAAIDFLVTAFGFEERFRFEMPDGKIGHAELGYGDARISLASEYPVMGLVSPLRLDGWHSQIYVAVEDVDAHYARARAAGATIAVPPRDQDHGQRMYRASDPEGHRWLFGAPLAQPTGPVAKERA